MATANSSIMSTTEAAERLRHSDEYVRRMIRAGALRGRLIAGRWLVASEDVERLAAQQQEGN